MKICLVKPTQTGRNLRRQITSYEPLGLEYLSAWIKKRGFEVEIYDAHMQDRKIKDLGDGIFRVGADSDNIKKKLLNDKPDLIGISCLFREYALDVIDIVNLCSQILPKSYVVLGGQDAATRPEFYFKHSRPDLIVSGEGELTFDDIVLRLAGGNTLSQIPGTIELKSGRVIRNQRRERITNLDVLPLPDRNLLPYLEPCIQKITYPFAKKLPATIIQSSRGCVMKCAFCDIISVWDKWISRSPDRVVGEIEYLNRNLGIKEFSFIDDNFMLDKTRVKEICREIIERKLNISFEVNPGISVWNVDKEAIDLMVKAGLYRICLPIESGSKNTLNFIGKPVDLDAAKKMIKYCNKLGLYTYGNILIGFPFEKKEDIEESISWAFGTDFDMVHFLIAEPYNGAKMFDIYAKNNWIDLEDRVDFNLREFRTEFFSLKELNEIRNKAQLRYFLKKILQFLNPIVLARNGLPKINSLPKLKYSIRIIFRVMTGTSIPENFAIFKLLKRGKNILLNYR